MRLHLLILLIAGFVTAFAPGARAAAEKLVIESPHTQLVFSINHLGFSNSFGKFTDYEGFIMFDQEAPAQSSVEISIKTASVDMDDEKWNEHLKNADFFNVEKFPDMTFKSTAIDVTGDNTANITGDLTLLGVTKPVTLAAVLNKADKHPMGDKTGAGFSATTKIKRSDFGMNYGLPMVGDDVDIRLEVEAYAEDKSAAGVESP